MGYEHLEHWTSSPKTRELVDLIKRSKNVGHTLRQWFVQHGPLLKSDDRFDMSKHWTPIDVFLLVQDKIIHMDDVPDRIWTLMALWSNYQYNHGIIKNDDRLCEIWYDLEMMLNRVFGIKDYMEDIEEE